MYNPEIKVLSCTTDPEALVMLAASQAIMKDPAKSMANQDGVIRFCYKAGHGSVLEHAVLSMRVTNVSRNFMAQIRTHRLASFTCSSQHYQDYTDYPHVCPEINDPELMSEFMRSVSDGNKLYERLVAAGVPVYEARYAMLPTATVNMIITANAREWARILNLRLCERNVPEMRAFARKANEVLRKWFPSLFNHVGPDCYELGHCTQGKMTCGRLIRMAKQAKLDNTAEQAKLDNPAYCKG